MTPAELEKWAKKILKFVQLNGMAIRCSYQSMSIAEWNSCKRDNNENVETCFGFPVTQDCSCLVCICEMLLLRMNFKQWEPKRRLSTIFGGFNDELKGKVNPAYLFLGNDWEIAVDDRDVVKIFNDLLKSWIRGAKYIIKKEALGPGDGGKAAQLLSEII